MFKLKRKIKLAIAGVTYVIWQIGFPILISPLVLGVLTAEQMGYTLNTVWQGIFVGIIFLIAIAATGIWTSTSIRLFSPALKHIKTREEFEEFWTFTLRGCDDGIVAETHWSGTILPLFMLGFAALGIPYPFNAIPAIFLRWIAHVGAHFIFPKTKKGYRVWGGNSFLLKGLLLSDLKNSLAFLISGNIIAPVMLHHLDSYVTTWTGNKEKVAKSLGISLKEN